MLKTPLASSLGEPTEGALQLRAKACKSTQTRRSNNISPPAQTRTERSDGRAERSGNKTNKARIQNSIPFHQRTQRAFQFSTLLSSDSCAFVISAQGISCRKTFWKCTEIVQGEVPSILISYIPIYTIPLYYIACFRTLLYAM
jgi:hypothetical protein